MDIAILGTRGIPARYGGFETFAEQLSTRLVARGHRVTVACRAHYATNREDVFKGVRLVSLPAIQQKYLETVSHTALSVVHSFFKNYDVVLICNAANAVFCWLPRLRGQKVVLNVDGIERRRRKWNWLGKTYYGVSERLAVLLPNRVIADARVIQKYYREKYGVESTYIPYGAPSDSLETTKILKLLSLEPERYFLYVSRLEPENNAHLVMQAFLTSSQAVPLVVVGDAPYSAAYKERLHELRKQGNIFMPGAIYGRDYRELLSHCTGYFQATEVGGTHPALVEAMGAGCLVVAHDSPENKEVVSDTCLLVSFYDRERLGRLMDEILLERDKYAPLRRKARLRVQQYYDWEKVTDQYEALFRELVS